MVRGTFANIRLKNLMVPGVEGGVTVAPARPASAWTSTTRPSATSAEGTPLVVHRRQGVRHAARSRDWAAKGTLLLGVRAVIAESYERIHRSNLVGMGVLPLQFKPGRTPSRSGLTGRETLDDRAASPASSQPRQDVTVEVERADGADARLRGRSRASTRRSRSTTTATAASCTTVLRKMLQSLKAAWPGSRSWARPRTVTGSQYLVEAGDDAAARRLRDVPGRARPAPAQLGAPPFDPRRCAALVLTHTHIDHIGRVPRLVQAGLPRPRLCTPPTRELAEVLLEGRGAPAGRGRRLPQPQGPDPPPARAAALRRRRRGGRPGAVRDGAAAARTGALSPAFSFRFRDAGHLLGAASVDLRVQRGRAAPRACSSAATSAASTPCWPRPRARARRPTTWWSRAPTATAPTPRCRCWTSCEGVLERTFARGGVLLIPAFAVGRAQQMIYLMDQLVTEGRLRPFPIHLDSPMAIDATRIYAPYPGRARRRAWTGSAGAACSTTSGCTCTARARSRRR